MGESATTPGRQSYKDIVQAMELDMQSKWADEAVDRVDLDDTSAPARYVLGMFPYPSGNAHMGHVLVFAITDVMARMGRFKGDKVLNPLGWDAFGLPAENAAFKNKLHPATWTEQNIAQMREQFRRVGFSFDYSKELNTSSPEFYRWTQWLFLKLHEHGLLYRAKSWVNWDPVDQTVLANEQVIDGRGWRSGAPIERREMEQWCVRITAFAEDLWKGLDELPGWSERAIGIQRNWIGRSEGAEIRFPIAGTDDEVTVFTTRPDTVFGVTSLTLAPEHPDVQRFTSADRRDAVDAYVKAAILKTELERQAGNEKSGVPIGAHAINPMTGEQVPVYVSDYVIASYGTGAIMNVPAHDARDHEFAIQEGLPIKVVIRPEGEVPEGVYEGEGTVEGSGEYDGMTSQEMRARIPADFEARGVGARVVRFRLRDWSVSRQRFWGCPIPMLRRADGSWEPVPEDQLPVQLPMDVEFEGSGSPLARSEDFLRAVSPTDGSPVTREVDTLDTFVCSSWYAWRYLDATSSEHPWTPERAERWMPIDSYVGGIEHANLHMIYFRFISHFLHSIGMTPTKEPVAHFLDNGLVRVDGAKMSKSKGNTITPSEMIEQYGADALRLYVLSDTPFERDRDWDESGLQAKARFVGQIWSLYQRASAFVPQGIERAQPAELDDWATQLLAGVYGGVREMADAIDERRAFHVGVAQLHAVQGLLSSAFAEADEDGHREVYGYALECYLKMLGVFAPHAADALWREALGMSGSLFLERWPEVDDAVIAATLATVQVPVQINGKRRAELTVAAGATDDELRSIVFSTEGVTRHVTEETAKRVVYVRDAEGRPKLVNIVAAK